MRVLVLSQYFPPEPIPKPADLARALRDAGHDVDVLTSFPQYPKGRRYDGYPWRPWRRDVHDGAPVLRVPSYAYHGRSLLRRGLNFGTFVVSAVLARGLVRKPDVIYVWHPPLTVGIVAWILGRSYRVPFVYDVQDIWPDAIVAAGMLKNPRAVRWLERLERFVYARASHILVPNDAAREVLIAKGVPVDRVSALPHWIEGDLTRRAGAGERQALRASLGWRDEFVALFAGNLGVIQGLDTLVRAAALLHRPDVRIVFVGDGTERARLQALAGTLGVQDRVVFLPARPSHQMPELFAAADALVVHLTDTPASRAIVPTKTVAYLAAARPIVMAMKGAAADLVDRAQAGVTPPPGDAQAVAAALEALAAAPLSVRDAYGEAGRRYFDRHFDKVGVVSRYIDVLRRTAQDRP